MKGYRFYAKLPYNRGSKGPTKDHPAFTRANIREQMEQGGKINCVAIVLDENGTPYVSPTGNLTSILADNALSSGVSVAPMHRDYLHHKCVRIPAEWVKKLHPSLWSYVNSR
ncbi:hypothetical protein JT27_18165 [Alcaligenes faecalis]|uniref:hypothetical protein n=1 Tax=Alcaligenes faecalis TaxID=511 RepID=UPI00052CFD5D|nr:hypothetical protein [Alcaligenes faecalis]KGP00259.1 hypothetical protein JT27_18165 [Alcaligenes faecalis]